MSVLQGSLSIIDVVLHIAILIRSYTHYGIESLFEEMERDSLS